jgi:molybdopterin/thiamine biosynthesis adenylyltransferase
VLDTSRHVKLFDPAMFDKRVDSIGAGAVGSRVNKELGKLGVAPHIWDFDRVEEHNLANQDFHPKFLNSLKCEASKLSLFDECFVRATSHAGKATGETALGDVVFLQTDTMESRKDIWGGMKLKFRNALLIESRIGVYTGRVYSIDPNNVRHIEAYEKCLYKDEDAMPSECGGKVTIGATAQISACYAVWQFLRWYAEEVKGEEDVDRPNELIFSVNPFVMMTRTF